MKERIWDVDKKLKVQKLEHNLNCDHKKDNNSLK
jgi:hypothetical protein